VKTASRLNFMREMVKTEKTKKKLCCQTSMVVRVHGMGCVYTLPFLARTCVCTARVMCAVKTLVLAFLCFFTHFCFELAFGVNKKVLDNCVAFQWLWFDLKMIFRF